MFLFQLAVAFGIAITLWFIAYVAAEQRAWLYRRLAPWRLTHAETVADVRKILSKEGRFERGVIYWLDGKIFRELPGKFLADIYLECLGAVRHDNPDLIRILEIITQFGTLPQKAVFARHVIRGVVEAAGKAAPYVLDRLERLGYDVGTKRRLQIELRVAHMTRMITTDADHSHKLFLRSIQRPRIKRAQERVHASAPPRKGEDPERGRRASDVAA